LVGGVAWCLSTYMYPQYSDKMFVRIAPSKVNLFLEMAANNYEKLINPDLSDIADPKVKAMAIANIERAKKNFNRAAIISGGTILQSVIKEINQSRPKKFYYARQGYIGWITGFILQEVAKEYEALDEWN